MSEPAIELSVLGLKCDAEGCDYFNEKVTVDDYELWVNAPCPECGANLLSEADYELTKTISEFSDAINEIFPPGSFPDEPRASFTLEMDGSGIPEVGDLKWEETDEA